MEDLIIIPARKGSKRIPGKNMIKLGGKPLIRYTLEFADKVQKEFDLSVVVTSDDESVLELADQFGFNKILREANLSDDRAKTTDVCLDALNQIEKKCKSLFKRIHLFQPTTPFRKLETFRNLYKSFIVNDDIISIFSAVKEDSSHPAYMYYKSKNNLLHPFLGSKFPLGTRAQDLPNAYRRDGSFYSIVVSKFLSTNSFIPDLNKSKLIEVLPMNSVNIDTYLDLSFAEFLLTQNIYHESNT